MNWLKQLRKERGMTQQELSEAAALGRAAYSNIETGHRRPSVEAAKRIGQALGFDWTRFYEEPNQSANKPGKNQDSA